MTPRTRALVLAAAVAALASPAALRADDTASPIDPVEDRALREEARARYDEALGSFREAFGMAVKDAAAAEDEARAARGRARAEAYLEKIDDLTGKLSAHRSTEEFLRGFEGEELGPALRARVEWVRARYVRQAGQVDQALDIVEALGFVSAWWVVGPFDNERGRGFAAKMGPEGEQGVAVDLQATYPGKERPVEWRRVPATHPYGWVDLNAMMRPNDQALAYAATWIRMEEPREVSLRLGSDEGLVVWVNGSEVLRRDIHRRGGFDQDAVGVRLGKGWNRVLLKVAENVGDWGFRLRVTDPEGNPLTGLAVPGSEEELEVAAVAPETGAPTETLDASRGALDYLEAVAPKGATAEEGSEDARAYFYLGLLHRARQYDDQKETQSDRKYLERAAKLRPDDPVYRFHAAEAATRPIEMSVEKEENEQRRGREKAIALDPEYAEAYYALAQYYTYSLPNLPRAEEMARRAVSINGSFLDAQLLLVDIVRKRGFGTEAEVMLRSVIARPEFQGRTAFLRTVAEHGTGQGLLDAARDAYRRALGVDFEDDGARQRLAQVLIDEGLQEDAVGVFDERIRLNGFDLDAYRRKAYFLEGLGRFADAAATAAAGLEIAPEDEYLLGLQGRVLHRMGKKDDAVARWKEALRVNPKDAALKRYVEWLDPSLKPYELPYVEDAATLLAAVQGREDANPENDPSMVVLDKAVTKVNPDGTNSVFTQKVIKILNNQGVKDNARYFAGRFWASDQSFEWRTARVWRKDGSVEEAQVQSGSPFVRWPQLQPGDAIEVQHRVDELKQSFFGDYFGDSWIFTDRVPVVRSEYVLLAPVDRELQFHTRNMPEGTAEPSVRTLEEEKLKVYSWTLRNRDKVRWEPAMPDWSESQPMVQVTTYKSWDHFAEWWWNLIKKQFVVDDAMREKVAELTKDAETRLEKVQAIYDFVVTDIQYQAWEFGVHGYKPYTATSIFHRKWGDCKDKAILMRTMLDLVDIEAYPVLIMASQSRSEQDMTLAQVGHFNHCIAFVPDVDGEGTGMFLDGTAQYNSMRNIPAMDRGAKVLVVRPEGGEVVQIPWNDPREFSLDQEYDIALAPDGSAQVAVGAAFRGDFSVMARSLFSVEGKRALVLQQMLGPVFGKFTLGETDFPDLKDITRPEVRIGLEVKADKLGRGDGSRMEVPVKFLDMFNLSRLTALEEREHDIVFMNPISFGVTARITVPEGWKVGRLPDPKSIELPFGSFRVESREEGGKVVYERRLTVSTNRIPKEKYAEFREVIAKANNATTEKVVLERVSGSGSGGAE